MTKVYEFEREDGSGVSFDIARMPAAENRYCIVNLSAFDVDGNEKSVSANDVTFAWDCFLNQSPPDNFLD